MTALFLVMVSLVLVGVVLLLLLRERALSREQAAEASRGDLLVGQPRQELPAPNLVEPPPELREALRDGECVLFLGSDESLVPDVPSRRVGLRSLLAREGHRLPDAVAEAVERDLERGDLEPAAQLLANRLGPQALVGALRLSRRADVTAPRPMRQFAQRLSGLPFSGVLTDSWSPIEDLFMDRDPRIVTPSESDSLSLQRLFRAGNFFVAHLNGVWTIPATLRLSWQQFRQAVHENREFERFLGTLHASRSLFFVGAEIQTIERYFEAAPPPHGRRRHFALVPWDPYEFALDSRGMQERFEVRLIPYLSDGTGQQVRFLEALREETRVKGQVSRQPPTRKPPRATALRLQNIGPFQSLELSLGPVATVFLGDNGSGKSTALRAVALALAGEGSAVNEAATGLLRAGARVGSVELELEGETLRTVLERSRSGEVTARAEQLSPVDEGLWLALGFPPLRGASGEPSSGPGPEGELDPCVQDLLPLAGSWVDRRFRDLQQWILNTAVAAESSSDHGRRAAQMIKAFFEIIAELTPGVDFEFVGYEPESWRVLLKTEDGVLSADQLSRGMTAMLAWVGVLLRRLFQVYAGDVGRPQDERALVLVDEIDLHLHPAWQRQVVPLLRRHFPNVQLIATTHSPLVVGSMTEGYLVQLQRERGKIVPEVFSEGFTGWRSDQILTGPAFDLRTTRDSFTEERLAEYRSLLARPLLTSSERERVEALRTQLREEIPDPQETEAGRQGARLVREAIRDRLGDLPVERREEVFREADVYLGRLQGGGGKQ